MGYSAPVMTTSDAPSGGDTTHFGYRTVSTAEKPALVRGVFDDVARKYDLMNDLMSMGVHRLWKRFFLDRIQPHPGRTLLDLGGGTGDIAFGWRERGGGPVTVCDLTQGMLQVGRDRAIDRNLGEGIEWICGDAESLPFPDMSFNTCTIAFCLRNVTHIDAALAEAYRVLKPGGRFFCLEFSKVALPPLAKLYDRYSFSVLPMLGRVIAGNRDAYQYLAESIRRFPPQDELVARMTAAGFDQVRYANLSGGIVAIHSGWRL
jgi:demethylmenaquinone methyltransferase/2-methoxy-6-polyprenyl-1,4-benzoquinol methylase